MQEQVLKNIKLEEIDAGIFSCLSHDHRVSDYDNKVNAYDLVVGNRFYNRIMWGNWPSQYEKFCKQALNSNKEGVFLDVGCGSLVFTANAYAQAENKLIVLLDRSIGMLQKGKKRIMKRCGKIPKNIIFLQADAFDLPFQNNTFDTVASFGVLHVFEERLKFLAEMERVKNTSGKVFFSSLVGDNTLGRKYLNLLKKKGIVATPHTSTSLKELLHSTSLTYQLNTIGNMAYGESNNLKDSI